MELEVYEKGWRYTRWYGGVVELKGWRFWFM